MIILTSLGSLACALSSDQFKPIRTKIYRQIKLKNKQFSCRTSLWPLIVTEARIFLPKLILFPCLYGLYWNRRQNLGRCTDLGCLAFTHYLWKNSWTFPMRLNCVLKSETWKMSLDRIKKTGRSYIKVLFHISYCKGGEEYLFFFFFCFVFFLPGSLSKGFALFGFHSAVCRQIAYGIMHRRHQLFENRENSKIKASWWRGERRVFNLHRQT